MPVCLRCKEEFVDRTNKIQCWKCRRILKILKRSREEEIEEPAKSRSVKPASCPTKALPGTPEKMEVISQRLAAGENPYHPDDAKPEIK